MKIKRGVKRGRRKKRQGGKRTGGDAAAKVQIKMERVRGGRDSQRERDKGEMERAVTLEQHQRQPLLSARGGPLGQGARI